MPLCYAIFLMNERVSDAFFPYRNGRMFCERASLAAIARKYGTPCYVMSASAIRASYAELSESFGLYVPEICYAVKANDSLAILGLLAREGAGAEVVSGGELFKALRARVPASRIVFSGVGKTPGEIRAALEARVMLFNAESVSELHAISREARAIRRVAPVAIRVNPHVEAHTHRYITTGTAENKFGIDITEVVDAFRLAARLPGLSVQGVHCHIGSQITEPGPFLAAAKKIDYVLAGLARHGIFPVYRNMGGGFGVSYRSGERRLDVRDLARRLAPHLGLRGLRVIVEPGRFLVGEAGVLLTSVVHVKKGVRRNFAVVDSGMTDLMRPCLYQAYHEIRSVRRSPAAGVVDVVGPVCESADFLGLGRRLPRLGPGDLLAVMGAGAYGRAMASNYNGRLRAAEVMVDGGRARLIRRRESCHDLMRGERR